MKGHLPVVRFSYVAMTVGLGLLGALPAHADISYSCDPTIDATQAGTCAYLNGALAGLYKSIFNNATASIYIQQEGGGLGGSTTALNDISYSTYLNDLTTHSSHDAIDTAAVAALNAVDTAAYNGSNVIITSALAVALGVSGPLGGVTKTGAGCTLGTSNCYNGVITIASPASLGGQGLYWNQTGGTQPGNAYDFYSVVEHETDEILGTASCIDTQTTPLSDFCGAGVPSAVDLFRYSAPGSLVPDSALSTTPGAYFSFDGGATKGAAGAIYNTLDNGDDYADFASNCKFVQDATGCLGMDLELNNDGGAEVNILDAVGFNQNTVPEPGTISLFAVGLAGLVAYGRRRRA
jgi:hypothetical protein